jgi:anaerobic magnesium-protoporphyrin IX monomethyl ester cyclase
MQRDRIDVVLVNPGSRSAQYQNLGAEFSAIEPPSLAAMFATYLRTRGQSVAIIDAPAENLSARTVAERVRDLNPHLVVLVVYGFQPSASTQNMTAAGAIALAIKSISNPPILMTGTHPAALPRRTMHEEKIDYVCSGEGPRTITQLAMALKHSRTDAHKFVPDLYYLQGDVVMNTPAGELLPDLDAAMPGAAWDLLPMHSYRAHNWHAFDSIDQRSPYVSIHTSLGCPYKCSFCCINAPFGKSSYRMWSPDVVVRELDMLVNSMGVRNIKFVDEMFVLNRAHVLGICEGIKARGLGDALNIWAYARVDTVKDEFLDELRSAGFRWLALGIESASKHVRDGVEKGRFGSEEIIKTVRKIQAAGINVIGNYIFGLPDDTRESMYETLALAKYANCEFANFYSAMAYPGSKLYTDAIDKGWELPASWIGYSQHSYETHPLRTETLTSAEVLAFRDYAFREYFTDSSYLSMVRKKFGPKVVEHIGRMVAQPLPRKLLSDKRGL